MVKYNRSTEKLKHPLFRETCHGMYKCRLLLFFACNLGCSNWEKETFANKFEIEVDPMGCSSNRCKCRLWVCVIFSIFGYTWSQCTVKNKKENFVVEIQRKGNSVHESLALLPLSLAWLL